MVPWFRLPALHRSLYGGAVAGGTPQLLPVAALLRTYVANRLRRVLEDDYGSVAPAGAPDRAAAFIGSLGVSFLTV